MPPKQRIKWAGNRSLAVEELVKDMVTSDLALFERDKMLKESGHTIRDFNE